MADPQNYGIGNLILPKAGPVVVVFNVDMTVAKSGIVDLTLLFERGLINYVQGIMIDNWGGAEDIFVTVEGGTGQRVICPAHSQIWAPIFVPQGATKFDVSAANSPGIVIPCFLYNIPLQPMVNRKTFPAV